MGFRLLPGHVVLLLGRMRASHQAVAALLAQVGISVTTSTRAADALIYADTIAGIHQVMEKGRAIVRAGKPRIQENRFFVEHLPELRVLADPNRVVAQAWPRERRAVIGF